MEWFSGAIPDAIKQAQSKQVVFVVYITGSDDVSKQMDETWSAPEVADICKSTGIVALKLTADSEACQQFSQFYPVVCVPSTFFISNSGVPLEVTGGHVEPEALISRITKADQDNKPSGVKAESPSAEPAESSKMEVETPPHATEESKPSESSSTPDTSPSTAEQPSTSAQAKLEEEQTPAQKAAAEERIQKAKELVAKRQEEKAQEAKEKEKNEEIKRRKMGQDMVKFKEWKEEMKKKEEAMEWKKDREQEKLARQRVKEQIAIDRAERSAKFAKEKEEREKIQAKKKKVPTATLR